MLERTAGFDKLQEPPARRICKSPGQLRGRGAFGQPWSGRWLAQAGALGHSGAMRAWILAVLLSNLSTAWALDSGGYRVLPDLDVRVFRCSPNPEPVAVSSAAQLQQELAARAPHCAPEDYSAARAAFEEGLRAIGIDWTHESLVVVGDWYGTGMARARLEFRIREPRTLHAQVAWSVPPPPLTPDTAVYFGAFVVDRRRFDTLEVSGRDPTPRRLPLAP